MEKIPARFSPASHAVYYNVLSSTTQEKAHLEICIQDLYLDGVCSEEGIRKVVGEGNYIDPFELVLQGFQHLSIPCMSQSLTALSCLADSLLHL